MKKITAIEIVILFIAGLIPLLWLKEGYIISTGDEFPLFLNPQNSLASGMFLWSPNFLGSSTPQPSYAFYLYPGAFLSNLGLGVGTVQILFQTLLFMVSGFSMYYFAKTVYPKLKVAGFIAGFFYMFNFFVLDNTHNIGFVWTYAFLPLLLALFAKVMDAAFQQESKPTNTNIIYFALVSVVAFSFASINPANLALMLFGLAILALYYLVKFRRKLRHYLFTFGKIAGLSIPINLWWIIPILNYYYLSFANFNSTVSANAWAWTQFRSSFLNLFWLNGFWGWSSEYDSSYNSYNSFPVLSSVLMVLVFVPFIVAASALLFKSGKSRFNLYIMGSILVLLFLARGLYPDPILGWFNTSLLYQLPLMSMFREPVSKFTLVIVPFLALLIGFAAGNFAYVTKLKISKFSFPVNKSLAVSLLLIVFVAAVSPLIINPIIANPTDPKAEPKSYVQIPDYWYQATSWINNQQGDWKVLITPLDDYYQMNYAWGYYGTDQLVETLFDKPIVSTSSLDGYKINPNASLNLHELYSSIRGNRTSEFKAMLDLLNIKYVFQRNDVEWNMTNRYSMTAFDMQSFFSNQPYLRLVQKFGSIDIYEYTESKPLLYTLSPSSVKQTDIEIDPINTLEKEWSFTVVKDKDVSEWNDSTPLYQSQGICEIKQYDQKLNATLSNSTSGWSGWITVNSPPLPAQYDTEYKLNVTNLAGTNTSDVQIQIEEYAADMSILNKNASIMKVGWGNFTITNNNFSFEMKNLESKFFRLQIWNFFNSNETTESSLSLSDVEVSGQTYVLQMGGIENLHVDKSANILEVQKTSPTKMAVTLNATEPFVLVTSQVTDNFWVAYMNGEQIKPTSLYLGLQGFYINKTGQLDITIEYEPQLWFYYASVLSIATTMVLFAILLYASKNKINDVYKKHIKQKGA